MKENELMIGDWVYAIDANGEKHPCRANNLEYDYTNKRGDYCVDFYGTGYEVEWPDVAFSVEPIPLTPEILEKNGFERRDDLMEDGFLPFILDRNDTEECYEVVVEWRDYYDNGAADAFNVEIVDECWKLHVGCEMKTYISTQDIIFVHELQHALRLCGIEKEIEL